MDNAHKSKDDASRGNEHWGNNTRTNEHKDEHTSKNENKHGNEKLINSTCQRSHYESIFPTNLFLF